MRDAAAASASTTRSPRSTWNARASSRAYLRSVASQYARNCASVTGAGARAGADMDPEPDAAASMGSVPCTRCISNGAKKPGSSHTSRATARNCSTSSALSSPPNRRAASCSFSALSAAGHASASAPR